MASRQKSKNKATKDTISLKRLGWKMLIPIILIPIIINILLTIPTPPCFPAVFDNDWLAFWGNVVGACLTGIITILVLSKTLEQNHKHLEKTLGSNEEESKKRDVQYKFQLFIKLYQRQLDNLSYHGTLNGLYAIKGYGDYARQCVKVYTILSHINSNNSKKSLIKILRDNNEQLLNELLTRSGTTTLNEFKKKLTSSFIKEKEYREIYMKESKSEEDKIELKKRSTAHLLALQEDINLFHEIIFRSELEKFNHSSPFEIETDPRLRTIKELQKKFIDDIYSSIIRKEIMEDDKRNLFFMFHHIGNLLFEHYGAFLGQYFRSIYYGLEEIDTTFEDKIRYHKIFRSQFSRGEVMLIFLNAMSSQSSEKTLSYYKDEDKKYDVFNNLQMEDLLPGVYTIDNDLANKILDVKKKDIENKL